jgi:hypothetical protein
MRPTNLLPLFLGLAVLTGCATNTSNTLSGQLPITGPIIPSGSLALSTKNVYSYETLAAGAMAAGLLYLVYDPLAPNWSVEETPLSTDTFYLSMRAKSFRTGGDGEAIMILKRRALKLQRENGFTGYRILDYSEGIESSTPFSHRVSEGTIQLVRAEVAPVKAR